jgi:hypothetical protein
MPRCGVESCENESADCMVIEPEGRDKIIIPICDYHYYLALRMTPMKTLLMWEEGLLKENK